MAASLIGSPDYYSKHDQTRLKLIELAETLAPYDAEFILKVLINMILEVAILVVKGVFVVVVVVVVVVVMVEAVFILVLVLIILVLAIGVVEKQG